MLDIILKSKIRQQILLLFLYNPDQSYYINETARIVDTSAGNAKRELEKLRKSSLLKKQKKGNSVYFSLNKENPILSEVKSIVDKTIGLENILEKEISKLKNIDFAFLFGSYVKGDFNSNSDIDLYIIGKVKEKDVYDKIRKVENNINQEINYHISSKEEFRGNLKKSFFHKEILNNYNLIIGSKDDFKRLIK